MLGVVLGVWKAPAFLALSAFVGAGLVFAGVTGWCGMAKLLGLMPWNRAAEGRAGLMLAAAIALASGGLIGLVLGLIGGGGSILAVPLLVYAVGVPSAHVAIGTAAFAVALNAATSLGLHAWRTSIRWPCALVFSAAGVGGALAGAAFGKSVDGQKLLALFGLADDRCRRGDAAAQAGERLPIGASHA